MGIRERKIEHYLDEKIQALGGITRAWKKSNVDGVPDQIVIIEGIVVFVEVKTVDGKTSSAQDREIQNLKDAGAYAYVVYGHADVDRLVSGIKNKLTVAFLGTA